MSLIISRSNGNEQYSRFYTVRFTYASAISPMNTKAFATSEFSALIACTGVEIPSGSTGLLDHRARIPRREISTFHFRVKIS